MGTYNTNAKDGGMSHQWKGPTWQVEMRCRARRSRMDEGSVGRIHSIYWHRHRRRPYDQVIFLVFHQGLTLLRSFSFFTSTLGPIKKKHKHHESVRQAIYHYNQDTEVIMI